MDTVKKWFDSPLEIAVAVSGLSLLGFYALYARKQIYPDPVPKQQNSLDLRLEQLVKDSSPLRNKIIKIVITQAAYRPK